VTIAVNVQRYRSSIALNCSIVGRAVWSPWWAYQLARMSIGSTRLLVGHLLQRASGRMIKTQSTRDLVRTTDMPIVS
jgi:hypothetical protein